MKGTIRRERRRGHPAELPPPASPAAPVIAAPPTQSGADAALPAGAIPADIPPEQVYHDAALATLTAQVGSNDVLDGKASQALTIGSAAVALAFTLQNALRNDPGVSGFVLDRSDHWFLVVAAFFYLAIIICNICVSVLNTQALKYGINLAELKDHVPVYVDKPFGGRSLKLFVANKYLDSIQTNESFLRKKSRLVYGAQASQQLAVITLVAWTAWVLKP